MKAKGIKVALASLLCLGVFVLPEKKVQAAEDERITIVKATGKSTAGMEAALAIDGDPSTYYVTPPKKSMQDHYRNIDLTLDGVYRITKIKIFNKEGSYNNYQIYASDTKESFDKIAYKNDTKEATKDGDEYTFQDLQASTIRINLSYNSAQLEGNLGEVELYGTKITDGNNEESKIEIEDFKDTKWADEYEKFESDEQYAEDKIVKEASALVGRVIGEKWIDAFVFEMREANAKGNDIFEIENSADGKIVIRGNSGIALASGFNHYLRYYCKVDYNPLFTSNLDMPAELPAVDGLIVKETEYDVRYALNFCTYSYTMAFWGWEQYEAFLDWAAMSGVNTMLDIVGQEEVIYRTLSAFGYSDDEIKEYIVGPGYFAWFYMQNMTSFGGKLPNNWFENRVELGRRMHDRMQVYGITPVMGGYSGQIPRNFKEKYPDVEYIDQGTWAGSGYERPDMIRTYLKGNGRDYFSDMADAFYQAQKDVFGDVTHMYSVDPFHEGGKMGDMNPTTVYETIQKKMMEHDEDAVWLIQEWSGSIASNPAKLTNLDKDHVLVLDLFSEVSPRNSAMESAETPWVWNMLHNFGGRMGLDGNPEKISQEIPKSYQNAKYMKGIGITPEAIENTPMVYELLFDMTWTKDPVDYREWTKQYVERNYGGTNEEIQEAWDILLDTGYNKKEGYYQGAPESVFNSRPRTDFNSASSWGHSTINYDKDELERAAALLANNYDEFKDKPSYIYDLSDVLRQVLSNSGLEYYKAMMTAYNAKNLEQFKAVSKKFLEMIEVQDKVLSTNPEFLVGTWIESSRTVLEGADDWTKDLFEYNARTLITTWGSESECNTGLRDYSNRQWAGLTKDYYYPRWERFINDTITAMENKTALPNNGSYNWFLQESAWSTKKSDEGSVYATTASNENLKELADQIVTTYTSKSAEDLVDHIETKENIALGKHVSANVASDTAFPTNNLTDGNKGTAWKAQKNEKTFTLTVDLENVSSIDGIELSMEQVPKLFPYTYTVEVLRDGTWSEVAKDTSGSITTSNLMIAYKGIGSQVRFTLETQDTSIVPEVYELQIYGIAESGSDYSNVALGKPATAQGSSTTALTDGNPSTKWAGSNKYPSPIIVDLENEEYVEYINLYFEKAGIRFQYLVEVEDEAGNKTTVQDMQSNTNDLDHSYKISVQKKIRKIYVTLTGKADGGQFPGVWPCVAEIEAMQQKGQNIQPQNIASGKPGNVLNQNSYTTTKLTDGNLTALENVGSDVFPTTFQVDLGSDEMIEEVKIYFEKAGIRFQFQVEIEDSEGNKTVILDMNDNLNDLAASYSIPAQVKGSKINVTINGRAPGGSFYLASPAMTEIEAYAKPSSVSKDATLTSNVKLTDEERTALIDGNENTTINLLGRNTGEPKEFVLEFDKAVDIFTYELYKKSEAPMQYTVAYLPADENATWLMLDDKSANLKNTNKYIGEFDPVLAKKVKLTVLNDDAELSDFNIYQYNVSIELSSYITSLKNTISKLPIGEYPGNYTAEAKAVLEKVMADAEKKVDQGLNSDEIAQEMKTLKKAYTTFLKSYVTIQRSKLLSELTSVEALLKMEELQNNSALKTAYQNAYTIYDTANVTQQQLDEATEALKTAKGNALETVDAMTRFEAELAIASALTQHTNIGDRPGDVTQAVMDTLLKAIEQAEKDIASASTTVDIDAVRETLHQAVTTFESQLIVVDKAALLQVIAEAKTLEESLYGKDSWKVIQTALQDAQRVNEDTNASLSEVAQVVQKLQAAIDEKVLLNRSDLEAILQKADAYRESAYTKTSWKAFMAAVDAAKTVVHQVSVNQSDLDAAEQAVEKAMKALIKLNRSDLQDILVQIAKMEGSDYDAEEWNQLLDIVKEAKALLAQSSLEQQDVDTMVQTLQKQIKALTSADTIAARNALESALKKAKAYLVPDNYTFKSYTVFKKAYENAESLLSNEQATNSMLLKAVQDLDSSIKGLQKVSQDPKPTNPNQNGQVSNKPGTGDSTQPIGLMMLVVLAGGCLLIGFKRKKTL